MQAQRANAAVCACVAAARLTVLVPYTQPNDHLMGGHRHIMQCSCGHACCHKVWLTDSVITRLRRQGHDPLACPASEAHRHTCSTWSAQCVAFRHIIAQLWPLAIIVWDWEDLQELPRAHIDATVMWPQGQLAAKRFELDGPYHFRSQNQCRLLTDVQKDVLIRQKGVDMLRLHANDQAQWAQQIVVFVQQQQAGLCYTASYVAYNDLQ